MIKSPYPYFGGKQRVANTIWQGLGEVSNYVEPFCGSLAVLLANPKVPKIETVNDKDCFISNFWRAVSQDPEGVAKYADYPVHEADLHARHRWLISSATDEFHIKINTDPDYYDLKIAGWWVWGMGASIGNNWLQPKGLNAMPMLSSAGGGIHGLSFSVLEWFKKLQERTRRVRVCCGDWKKVVTPSITYKSKGLSGKDITAIFLDPPYDLSERDQVYKEDNNIFKEVCQWAIENGDNPKLRIALCGYDGDHGIPDTWKIYKWKANGGFANLGNDRGKDNASKETIWFSPHCLEIK
jgi:Site-specific DNA methylase